jgi:hypothetical protein
MILLHVSAQLGFKAGLGSYPGRYQPLSIDHRLAGAEMTRQTRVQASSVFFYLVPDTGYFGTYRVFSRSLKDDSRAVTVEVIFHQASYHPRFIFSDSDRSTGTVHPTTDHEGPEEE